MKMFLERVEFALLSTLFVLLLIGTGDANRELSGGDDSVTSKPVTSQPSSSVVLTKVVTLKPSKSLVIHSFMILYIVYFVHSGNSHTSCTLSKREAIIHLYFLWIYVKLIIFPLTYLFMIPIKIKLFYAMLNAHYKNNMVCNVFKLYFDNLFFRWCVRYGCLVDGVQSSKDKCPTVPRLLILATSLAAFAASGSQSARGTSRRMIARMIRTTFAVNTCENGWCRLSFYIFYARLRETWDAARYA